MIKSDFTYREDCGWIMIFPESQEAIAQYQGILDATMGTGKIFFTALPTLKAQLKQLGYTIRKQRTTKKMSDDELLALLAD